MITTRQRGGMRGVRAVAAAVVLIATAGLSGCTRTEPTGKFTEEEMSRIPLPKRFDLPDPTGGMTVSVDDETVTVEEIIEPLEPTLERLNPMNFESFALRVEPLIRESTRERVLEVLLYKRARKEAPESIEAALDKAVEQEVNRFVMEHGNDYASAQAALVEMGMDWDEYRTYQRRWLLVQSYMQKEMEDEPILPSDLREYYESVKAERFNWPGEVQFRIIDVIPEQIPAEQIADMPDVPRIEAARRLLIQLRGRVEGGEDFGELARQYSHGHRAVVGGLWRPITLGVSAMASPYDVLEAEAQTMQTGELVGPIESGGHLFLMQIESRREPGQKSFEEVQDQLEDEVEVFKRRQRYDRIVNRILAQTRVTNLERFVAYAVREAYARYQ